MEKNLYFKYKHYVQVRAQEGEAVPTTLWASEWQRQSRSGCLVLGLASYWFWCLSRITVLYMRDFCFYFSFLVMPHKFWWDYLGDPSVFSRFLVECIPFLQSALQERLKLHICVFIRYPVTHTSHFLMYELWQPVCFSINLFCQNGLLLPFNICMISAGVPPISDGGNLCFLLLEVWEY